MALTEPEQVERVLQQSDDLRQKKQLRPALEVLNQILAGSYGPVSLGVLERVYEKALGLATVLKDWMALESLANQAIAASPRWSQARVHLGEALFRTGRGDEAVSVLEEAIKLDPNRREARILRDLLKRDPDALAEPPRVRPFPKRTDSFQRPRDLIKRYILDDAEPDRFIRKDAVFVSMGSCFAENLASRLTRAGYKAHFELIGEEVNSTYANRYLLQWVEHGVVDEQTEAMDKTFGEEVRQRFRTSLKAVDVFVLTLGVAPCFFDRDTGDFAFFTTKWVTLQDRMYSSYVMRTTTVDENVTNIREIIASVRRLSKRSPKIVLTVSPVPLAGTTEYRSAVTADCVSKSTLRVAADTILREQDGDRIMYWPSFEIVRWCGPYYGRENPPVFGDNDGKTRHVSPWIIDMIIELFLERHSGQAKVE